MVLILFLAFVCLSQHSWHPTNQTFVKDVSNHYNTTQTPPADSMLTNLFDWHHNKYLQLLHHTPFVIVWVCKLVHHFQQPRNRTTATVSTSHVLPLSNLVIL